MKKNILKAVKLIDKNKISQQEILKKYNENIKSYSINNIGNLIELPNGVSVEDIDPEKEESKNEAKRFYPIYVRKKDEVISAYCIPIIGKGLWSTIYGYLALEPDLNTILGITFYKHGETPGLGSEIESESFQNKFIGKKIWDDYDKLVAIKILKQEPLPDSKNLIHEIEGITGATKTSEGVMHLLMKDLHKYEAHFRKLINETDSEESLSNVK